MTPSIRDRLAVAWNGFLNLLFPAKVKCLNCGRETEGTYLCAECEELISLIGNCPRCERCSRPLVAEERFCPSCSRGDKIYFDKCVSACVYDGLTVALIHKLKFFRCGNVAEFFADVIAPLAKTLPECDVVVPVPIKPSKIKLRGYNQCDLLGKGLCSRVNLPFLNALEKCEDSLDQLGLSGAARRRNVQGSVKVADGSSVRGKRVMLVDDVLTTGATLSECARVLKAAGATAVCAVTVAITPTRVVDGETGEILIGK